MEMMKAVAAMGDGTVKIVEVPKPDKVGPYDCLVRVTACGLCSSTDLKIIYNGSVAQKTVTYPTLLGHEGVGVIEQVGERVRYLKPGDRVTSPLGMLTPAPGYTQTFGGMNGYALTMDVKAMVEDGVESPLFGLLDDPILDFPSRRIPDGMSDPDAVMLLTMKENYSALKNFGVHAGSRVLIFGDGAVALGLSCFARYLGAVNVTVVGHHDERLARIAELAKVDLTLNSKTESVEEKLAGQKFDVCVDAAGSPEIVLQGAKFLVPCGVVGVYGVLKRGHSTIDLLDLPNNVSVHILNWPYHEFRQHDEMLDMIEKGVVDPKWFYSHVMPIDEAQKGVDMIRNREAYKVIFTME